MEGEPKFVTLKHTRRGLICISLACLRLENGRKGASKSRQRLRANRGSLAGDARVLSYFWKLQGSSASDRSDRVSGGFAEDRPAHFSLDSLRLPLPGPTSIWALHRKAEGIIAFSTNYARISSPSKAYRIDKTGLQLPVVGPTIQIPCSLKLFRSGCLPHALGQISLPAPPGITASKQLHGILEDYEGNQSLRALHFSKL